MLSTKYMVHGVVPGNVTSLVKLPSGWMSSGMSVMSPLIFSHTAILIGIPILGRESRSFPFSMAFPYWMTGSGSSALGSALCTTAFWGSASSGSFLLFSCIPQTLNPFSTFSPSVKSKEVALSDRGGKTNWNSASPIRASKFFTWYDAYTGTQLVGFSVIVCQVAVGCNLYPVLGTILGIDVEHGCRVTDDYFTHFDGSRVSYDKRWLVNHSVFGLQGTADTQ